MKSISYFLPKVLLMTTIAFPLVGKAQLVTINIHPFFSLTEGFLGADYTISNVLYTGDLNAVGQFDGSATNLGLTKGIIMTTGTIFNTGDGPHGPNNQAGSGFDNGMPGYSPLASLAGNDTYNAAVLEFDFIPTVDTLSLNYVFASEEYTEYVGSSFNDAFAIYISGPGVVGNEIISRLYNNLPVTINNVNNGANNAGPCQNCANYIYNGVGNDAPYNSINTYVQYDGFTTGLRAKKTGLQIGQTYHITIAIADAGDGILDSGIFLESCNTCSFNVGLNDLTLAGFSIYPNPSSGTFTLEIPSEFSGIIRVHNLKGKLVKSIPISSNESTLILSDLEKGMYLISARNESKIWQERIVVN